LRRKAFSTAGHARSWVGSHLEAGICARHNARSPLPKFLDQDFSMQIRNLGGSGLRVSAVGLGCNNFGQRVDLEGSRKVIHKALDLGITLFDTADIYSDMGGSENVLGAVLSDRRKDIVLATKYSKPMATDGTKQGASRRYIMNAVEASLKRLKTDYIDLYQQHDYDPLTPIEESLRALDDLVRQGKVRYIGNSNFPAWRVAEAEYVARAMNVSRFVSCQDEYSPCCRSSRSPAVFSPANTSAAKPPPPTRASARWPACATATSTHATRRSSKSCRPSRKRAATRCWSSPSPGWPQGRRSRASSPVRRGWSRSSRT
jgi:hypothetical protein